MPSSLPIFLDRSLVFDLLLVLVAGYITFSSVRRGCVATCFSLLALCCSYPISCNLFPLLASCFPPPVTARIMGDAIAFAALMSGVYFLTLLLIWAILALLKRIFPDVSDHIAAGFLGLLKVAVMMVLITMIAVTFLPPRSSLIKHSFIARTLLLIVKPLANSLPSPLAQQFMEKKEELQPYGKPAGKKK